MPHLDEGLMMALLDGELTASQLREADAHLRSCPDCSARLGELRGVMDEADGLVEELVVPPAQAPAPVFPRRSRWLASRTLAWAASVVAALGLGVAGGVIFLDQGQPGQEMALSPPERAQSDEAVPSPAPSAPSAPNVPSETRETGSQDQAAGGIDLTLNQAPPAEERADRQEADQPSAAETAQIPSAPTADGVAGRDAAKLSLRGRQDSILAFGDVARIQPGALRSGFQESRIADSLRRREAESLAEVAAQAAGRPTASERSRARRMAAEPAAPPALPLVPRDEVTTAQRRREGIQSITLDEAVVHLGGAIRLIDGLTPEELEVVAPDSTHPLIRVLYRVGTAESRLVLEQRRVDKSFVASDLQRPAANLSKATQGNRLSWNDLDGFALALIGQFSADSLFHFKTLVK